MGEQIRNAPCSSSSSPPSTPSPSSSSSSSLKSGSPGSHQCGASGWPLIRTFRVRILSFMFHSGCSSSLATHSSLIRRIPNFWKSGVSPADEARTNSSATTRIAGWMRGVASPASSAILKISSTLAYTVLLVVLETDNSVRLTNSSSIH